MTINQTYFNNILQKNFIFEKNPRIAVAVSGGPDSMALVFLLNQWIKKNNGKLIALIVDHQIRKESKIESTDIKKYLLKNNIYTKLLIVNKKNILKKNMKEARKNRFDYLMNYCSINNIFHLFVGQHFDDNIETFLLRKIAGSNFHGLRSMQYKINMGNLRLLRPLLDFKKNSILRYNKENNIRYVQDSSNYNLHYSRVAIRNYLSKNSLYRNKIEQDFDLIKNYFPFYQQMIFQIFVKLNIKTFRNKILIHSLLFFKYDELVQIKIIEIIYKFLKPKRTMIRYTKTKNALKILRQKDLINVNLAGMIVNKDKFLINFIA